ncbi:SCO family protein [Geoalkalibacter sp.]|uniref:SCO family protein n=1 Tax=Geoalkalibacter sp. TaxID=3041440 RepID=UPI00272E9C65|nr:SCO family protein [Geoalkalibacter sp.]
MLNPMFRHSRLPLGWLIALLFTASVALGSDPHEHRHPPLAPPEERAPAGAVGLDERLGDYLPLDLAFFDEQGETVTLGELIRTPTIIAPVYYQCPNVCNFLQEGLAASLPKVRLQPGEQFQVLSISFDETETPAWARNVKGIHMTAMKNQFPEEAWRFLTGDAENIARFTEAIGYRFQRQGRDFLHPVAVVVVAPDGKIVRYLYGTSFLPMNLTLALLEGAEGRVGVTVKRMLEFCFSYDAHQQTYVFNLLRVSATVVIATALALLAFLLLSGRKKPTSRG